MHVNPLSSPWLARTALTGLVIVGLAPSFGIANAGPPAEDPATRGGESAPPTGGTGTGTSTGTMTGTSYGGFQPPAGATDDPNTTSNPGLLDREGTKTGDKTYGPSAAGDRVGYDIIDTGAYQVQTGWNAEVPDYHIVLEGDTLSGVCEYYYGDMYLWPKVWSFNPHITNPHWIFPGDRIRLTDPYGQRERGSGLAYAETYDPRGGGEETYLLERYAFIDEEDLAKSMEIIGGADPKVMMATLDTAYIGYKEENPPIPGERLSVYRKKQPVYDVKIKGKKGKRQKQGKRIGWLVEVVGEVYVSEVAPESAEALIVDSVQPIERGLRVGELKTRFARVSSTENKVTARGVVVETIREVTLTGEQQFVVINLGSTAGIRRGNTMEVVEKGDAYNPDHRLYQPYDVGHPRRIMGTLLVLQVEEESGLAVVTWSLQELEIGNHVEITKAGGEPEDFERYDASKRGDEGKDGKVEAEGEAGDGEVKGSLRVGG